LQTTGAALTSRSFQILRRGLAREAVCPLWVICYPANRSCLPFDVRFHPKATEALLCSEMTRRARSGCESFTAQAPAVQQGRGLINDGERTEQNNTPGAITLRGLSDRPDWYIRNPIDSRLRESSPSDHVLDVACRRCATARPQNTKEWREITRPKSSGVLNESHSFLLETDNSLDLKALSLMAGPFFIA
jgi:hypothetical protein